MDLNPDQSVDLGCRKSPGRWSDKEQFCAFTSYFSLDILNQSPNSSLPEESTIPSLSLDTHFDAAQVTSSSDEVIYCDDESLFSFSRDCSPNIESSFSTEIASARLTPFLDDVNIFEAETSELLPLVSSRLSSTCSGSSADAGTAASLSERSYQDDSYSDEDLMRDNPYSQAISCRGFDFTQDISGFDFTAIDDFGHGVARPSSECVSGVISVKGPCFPRRVESTADLSLSGLHVLSHDADEHSNVFDALDSPCRDMDFVAMDFCL